MGPHQRGWLCVTGGQQRPRCCTLLLHEEPHMRHWIFLFRPETYEDVKRLGLVGVRYDHRRRFAEVAEGARFVAYISRERVLDGAGVVTGPGFADSAAVAPGWAGYPLRAPVAFTASGRRRDARQLLWGLSECQVGIKTEPTNLLFCRGGFMEIPRADFDWLLRVLDEGDGVAAERLSIASDGPA